MRLDAKQIKSQLTLSHYEKIILDLGGDIRTQKDERWVMNTFCHHRTGGSYKLEFYPESKLFYCYTETCNGGAFDIISLIKTRWQLLGMDYHFQDVLNYIIDLCDLDIDSVTSRRPKKKSNIDNWQEDLGKYIKFKKKEVDIPEYDRWILNFFEDAYHQDWIDEGITIEAMEKFGIKWYNFRQQIVMPVYDEEDNFVGIHARNMIPELINMGLKYQPLKLLDGTEYRFPTSSVLYGLWVNKENIIKTKEVFILEAPKSVMQMESILEVNNSVALFGHNLSKYQAKVLLALGVEKVVICLDKQYKDINDPEFDIWEKWVLKIADTFKGYCEIEVVYDTEGLLGYKDSPSDCGVEAWNKLYENREII